MFIRTILVFVGLIVNVLAQGQPTITSITSSGCSSSNPRTNCNRNGIVITIQGSNLGTWGAKVGACTTRATHLLNANSSGSTITCTLKPDTQQSASVQIDVVTFPFNLKSNALTLEYCNANGGCTGETINTGGGNIPSISLSSNSCQSDSRRGLINCPAQGGVTITFTGTSFGTWGAQSNLCAGEALQHDTSTPFVGTKATCTLLGYNAGESLQGFIVSPTGQRSNVVTVSFSSTSQAPTPVANGNAPRITRIVSGGCRSVGNNVVDCPSSGGAQLTIYGQNLGWWGAAIPSVCVDRADHVKADQQGIVTCTLKPGSATQTIILTTWTTDGNDLTSANSGVTLSYASSSTQTPVPTPIPVNSGQDNPIPTDQTVPAITRVTTSNGQCQTNPSGIGLVNCSTNGGIRITITGRNLGWWGAFSSLCEGDGRAIHADGIEGANPNPQNTIVYCVLKALSGSQTLRITTYPDDLKTQGVYIGFGGGGSSGTPVPVPASTPTPVNTILADIRASMELVPADETLPALFAITTNGQSTCVQFGKGLRDCPTAGGTTITMSGRLLGWGSATSNVCIDGTLLHTRGKEQEEVTCTLKNGSGGDSVLAKIKVLGSPTLTNGIYIKYIVGGKYDEPRPVDASKPTLLSITSQVCRQNGYGIQGCPQSGNVLITFNGLNFGFAGAYSSICADKPAAVQEGQTKLICTLNPGIGIRRVTVGVGGPSSGINTNSLTITYAYTDEVVSPTPGGLPPTPSATAAKNYLPVGLCPAEQTPFGGDWSCPYPYCEWAVQQCCKGVCYDVGTSAQEDQRPVIEKLTSDQGGCQDDGNGGLMNCPTTGGIQITINGNNFGTFGLCTACTNLIFFPGNKKQVVCTLLPLQAGSKTGILSVVLTTLTLTGKPLESNALQLAYSGASGVQTGDLTAPRIFSIAGDSTCKTITIDGKIDPILQCPASGGAKITIFGERFGFSGASVFSICTTVTHYSNNLQGQVTCILKPGGPGSIANVVLTTNSDRGIGNKNSNTVYLQYAVNQSGSPTPTPTVPPTPANGIFKAGSPPAACPVNDWGGDWSCKQNCPSGQVCCSTFCYNKP